MGQQLLDAEVLGQAVEAIAIDNMAEDRGTVVLCFQTSHTELVEAISWQGISNGAMYIIDASGKVPDGSVTPSANICVVEGPGCAEAIYAALVDILSRVPFTSTTIIIDNLAYSQRHISPEYVKKFMTMLMYIFLEAGVDPESFILLESSTTGYATLSNVTTPLVDFAVY